MKSNLTLEDFTLGGPDAWDPQEGPNLEENFLPIQQFADIGGKQMTFLCGRRGSGKSAIARMLETRAVSKYSKAFQGERSEYGEYMNIVTSLTQPRSANPLINIKQAVRRLWGWALPVAAMQTIVKQASERGEHSERLTTIRNYLDRLPSPLNVDSSIGHLLSHVFQDAVTLPSGGFDTYLLNLTNSREFSAAVSALQLITRQTPALLVLDTLESYRIFQPAMIEGLQGVLEAISAFLADERMHGVSIKFFIPAEIYDTVAAGFPGKIHSRTVYMRWRAADLIAMLAKRFLAVLYRTEVCAPSELARLADLVRVAYDGTDGRHLREQFWYHTKFLPRTITNTVGLEEECFPYILRHTMRRPRDLITAQMQSIVNESVKRREFPYISQQSVVAGVHNTEALQQILGEALAPYEDDFSSALVRSARAAFYERQTVMNGRTLRTFAKELYSLKALDNVEPERFLQMLLQCGVIGLLEEQGDVKPSGPYFSVKYEHLMHGNLPLTDRLQYAVHPIMGDLFSMKPPENGKVIYPLPTDDLWLEEAARIV